MLIIASAEIMVYARFVCIYPASRYACTRYLAAVFYTKQGETDESQLKFKCVAQGKRTKWLPKGAVVVNIRNGQRPIRVHSACRVDGYRGCRTDTPTRRA
jgi:hypothetical protein